MNQNKTWGDSIAFDGCVMMTAKSVCHTPCVDSPCTVSPELLPRSSGVKALDCSLCRVIQQKDGHIRSPSELRMIRNIRNVWAPRKNRKSNFWSSNQSVSSSSSSSSSSNPSPSPSRAPPPPRPPPWTNKLCLGVQPRAKMRCPRAASTPPSLGSLLHSPSSISWHSPVSQALSSAVAAQTCRI